MSKATRNALASIRYLNNARKANSDSVMTSATETRECLADLRAIRKVQDARTQGSN